MSAPPDIEVAQMLNSVFEDVFISDLSEWARTGLIYLYYAIANGGWCSLEHDKYAQLAGMLAASPYSDIFDLYTTSIEYSAAELEEVKAVAKATKRLTE